MLRFALSVAVLSSAALAVRLGPWFPGAVPYGAAVPYGYPLVPGYGPAVGDVLDRFNRGPWGAAAHHKEKKSKKKHHSSRQGEEDTPEAMDERAGEIAKEFGKYAHPIAVHNVGSGSSSVPVSGGNPDKGCNTASLTHQAGRMAEETRNSGTPIREDQFLDGLTDGGRCLGPAPPSGQNAEKWRASVRQSLLGGDPSAYAVVPEVGAVAAFRDKAVSGGVRFAVAFDRDVCRDQGLPRGTVRWARLDDGFVVSSTCLSVNGLTGEMGGASVRLLGIVNW